MNHLRAALRLCALVLACALLLIATGARAGDYRPPGGPHTLYHGGDNQAPFPPLASVSVEEQITRPVAVRLAILSYPNPSRGELRFRMLASAGEEARVSLYSVNGRLIREWRRSGAGERWLEWGWDGRDAQGRHAPPGLYFYRADSGRQRGGESWSCWDARSRAHLAGTRAEQPQQDTPGRAR